VKRVWVWQHDGATVQLEALLMTDCAGLVPYSVDQRESLSRSTASSSLASSVLIWKDIPHKRRTERVVLSSQVVHKQPVVTVGYGVFFAWNQTP